MGARLIRPLLVALGLVAAAALLFWAVQRYVADRLEKNFRRTVFNAPGTMAAPVARAGFGRRAVA